MNIRSATDEDIPTMMPLLKEFHQNGGLKLPKINTEKVFQAMLACIRLGVILLAETKGGELAGILALMPTTFWYADDAFLADQVFYVSEKHRASSAGLRLKNMAEKVAENTNMRLIIGVFNNVDLERKEKFLTRGGKFKRLGGTYGVGF